MLIYRPPPVNILTSTDPSTHLRNRSFSQASSSRCDARPERSQERPAPGPRAATVTRAQTGPGNPRSSSDPNPRMLAALTGKTRDA